MYGAITEPYDPMGRPDATTNRLPAGAGREQRLNAKLVGDCEITIADDGTATPDVTFQLKDMRGRPLRGYAQGVLTGHTVSWGAVAGADVFDTVDVGLIVHAITADRIGIVRTDDNGKLQVEVDGSAGTFYLRFEVGGQVFQSPVITTV